jgi:hypothetical protein
MLIAPLLFGITLALMRKMFALKQETRMLKILNGFIICIAVACQVQAANIITFGKDSPVVFPHKEHQTNLGGCTECHGTKDPGPIDKPSKEWAHITCIGCHSENKAGPVECDGCHIPF